MRLIKRGHEKNEEMKKGKEEEEEAKKRNKKKVSGGALCNGNVKSATLRHLLGDELIGQLGDFIDTTT